MASVSRSSCAVLSPEDDPSSELNVLRRELRHLQSSLRDAALQSAAQAEETHSLRKALALTEAQLEAAHEREEDLQRRLDAETARVHASIRAADDLVVRLRALEVEMAPPEMSRPRRAASMRISALEHRLVPEPESLLRETRSLPRAQPFPRSARSLPNLDARKGLFRAAFGSSSPQPAVAALAAVRPVDEQCSLKPQPQPLLEQQADDLLPFRVSRSIDVHDGAVYSLASNSDGSLIASGGADRFVRILKTDKDGTYGPCGRVTESLRAVTSLCFLADDVLCAGAADGALRIIRPMQQNRRRARWTVATVIPTHAHSHAVRRILARDSGKQLLSVSTDRAVKITDVERGARTFAASSPSAVLDAAQFGDSSELSSATAIVTAHKDGGVRLWGLGDADASVHSAKLHARAAVSVCCLDDGHGIVSLGRDNALRLSDARMGLRVVREFEGPIDTISDWHRAGTSGRTVSCGIGSDGTLGMWNVDSGKLIRVAKAVASNGNGDAEVDVIGLVKKSFTRTPPIILPIWPVPDIFVCAHSERQISFWEMA